MDNLWYTSNEHHRDYLNNCGIKEKDEFSLENGIKVWAFEKDDTFWEATKSWSEPKTDPKL